MSPVEATVSIAGVRDAVTAVISCPACTVPDPAGVGAPPFAPRPLVPLPPRSASDATRSAGALRPMTRRPVYPA